MGSSTSIFRSACTTRWQLAHSQVARRFIDHAREVARPLTKQRGGAHVADGTIASSLLPQNSVATGSTADIEVCAAMASSDANDPKMG